MPAASTRLASRRLSQATVSGWMSTMPMPLTAMASPYAYGGSPACPMASGSVE